MPHPPVIPTPPAQLWLDFRVKWLPIIVFAIAISATGYVWKQYVFPASLVGRVEGMRADVSLPQAGVVTKLYVTRFQKVNAGDPIVEISPVDPKVFEASLAVIRADIDLLRSGVNPAAVSQRMAIDYDQLKLNWLKQKITLATTKSELRLAEIELTRTEQLWQDKIIAQSELDIATTKRDTLKISYDEQLVLTSDLEVSLKKLSPAGGTATDPTNQFRAAIAVEEEKLRLTEAEMGPRLLTAPISGTISAIAKWCGETAAAADPVVTISSGECERAIGYLRQPFYVRPTTNMMVRIRTRGFQRQSGLGRILAVGESLLPINDVLLPPTKYSITETGLPILVSLPPELKPWLRPGEFVDLIILTEGKQLAKSR